jgi:hypothetical protein
VPGRPGVDPGLGQPGRVGLALVAEDVALGPDHQGRRQAADEGRPQRRGVRGRAVGPAQVVVPVPAHPVRGQVVAVGELAPGGGVAGDVQHRVDQQLEGDRGPAAVAGAERDHRGQVAAGAVAGHGQAVLGPAQGGRVGRRPQRGRVRVLDRGRPAVLGGQPVVDRDDHRRGGRGQGPAQRVVAVQGPHHPAAAVEEDHDRERRGALGGVDPHRQLPGRPRDHLVGDRGHRHRRPVEGRGVLDVEGPGLGDRLAVQRRPARRRLPVQQRPDLGPQGHRATRPGPGSAGPGWPASRCGRTAPARTPGPRWPPGTCPGSRPPGRPGGCRARPWPSPRR